MTALKVDLPDCESASTSEVRADTKVTPSRAPSESAEGDYQGNERDVPLVVCQSFRGDGTPQPNSTPAASDTKE